MSEDKKATLEEALIHIEALIEFTIEKLASLAHEAIPDRWSSNDHEVLLAEFNRHVKEVRALYQAEADQ
jgi:hypothetical protein